jgi:hypothetical protein
MTQAKDQDKDYDKPWEEIIEKASRLLKAYPNMELHQKFTCAKCKSRQMMDTPNKFYTEGQCQECGFVTDLQLLGCGFLAHFKVPHT